MEFNAFDEVLVELDDEFPSTGIKDWAKMLYDINNFIWVLESGLKSGKEALANPHYLLDDSNTPALVKIGTTSMLIRNFNHIRVASKNLINKLCCDGYQDAKKDHLSC